MTKENLNLPKTSFSMRANLTKKEPEIIGVKIIIKDLNEN